LIGRTGISRARLVAAAALIAAGGLLVLASQWPARASGGAAAAVHSQAVGDDYSLCDADDDDPLYCGNPVDSVAGLLAADGTTAPDPRDADLGGVGATGVLLMSLGAATVAGSGAGLSGLVNALGGGSGAASSGVGTGAAGTLGGPSGGGAMAGAGSALGSAGGTGTLAATGLSLPLPRAELIQGGLSIFRSMKRVTEEGDPTGYSAGDVAQLVGDAASVAAMASLIAPAVGLISLVAGGGAAAADVKSPREIFEQLRSNVVRLGYMQGVVDENVSGAEGQLGNLASPAATTAAATPAPRPDPSAMSDAELRMSRTEWARRMDTAFDALGTVQAELGDLDVRRNNLAHQIDSLGDLLSRSDPAGSTPLPAELAKIVAYGRGWFFAGESSSMAAALRESVAKSGGAGPAPRIRASGPAASGGSPSPAGAPAAAPEGSVTLAEWAAANGAADGRAAVLQALAGLERWRGFYDALAASVQAGIVGLRVEVDQAVAARRDIAAEIARRAVGGAGR